MISNMNPITNRLNYTWQELLIPEHIMDTEKYPALLPYYTCRLLNTYFQEWRYN